MSNLGNTDQQVNRGPVSPRFIIVGLVLFLVFMCLYFLILFPERNQKTIALYVKDRSQLRQIGITFYAYAQDHDGMYPVHPLDAAIYLPHPDDKTSKVYFNAFQPDRDTNQAGRSDRPVFRFQGYVYLNLGQSVERWDDPSRVIQAYTAKVSPKQKKRGVLFADGHAETWDEDRLRASLPPDVDVDALDGP